MPDAIWYCTRQRAGPCAQGSANMRLIDADAFLEKMKRTNRYFDVKFDIEEMPTIDAVPVVRCRECEKRDKEFVSANGTISCPYMEAFMPAEGFCSYGERKEGAD